MIPVKHRTVFAAAIAAATLFAAPALAQAVPPPSISVTGEASVSVPPDLALVDGGVTSEAKTAREASDANNNAMIKVVLSLKATGIDQKDVQTSRLSLQPQTAPNRTGPSAITGYRASNRVTIRVRDVSKVANVIDTLVGAGANEIGGITVMVSQASKLLKRRGPRQGRRRRPPQGRDLCQGRRRHPRRAAQHFGRGQRAADALPQDVGRHGGISPGGAGRRDAFGDGQRVVGDQGEGIAALVAAHTALILRSRASLRGVSKDGSGRCPMVRDAHR